MTDAENDELDPIPQDDDVEATIDAEPDVLLDVSDLSVDEITLEVEDLQARVSLQADVLELLKLHVGVDVRLGSVNLTIKGVQAKALLKVRLDNIAGIIDRVMTTIDNNPDMVERLLEAAGGAVEDVGAAVGEVGAGAGSALEGVRGTVTEVVGDAGDVVDEVAEEARSEPPTEAAPKGGRRGRADSSGTRRAKTSRTGRGRQPKER